MDGSASFDYCEIGHWSFIGYWNLVIGYLQHLEVTAGFAPANSSFADCCLNYLAT